jgi:hypothetical protein
MCRHKIYAVQAEAAGASKEARLYATTGPNVNVMGERSKLTAGIDVVQVRLTPCGAHTRSVRNGLSPLNIAWGHQTRNHIIAVASAVCMGAAPFVIRLLERSVRVGTPKKTTEIAR